MLRKSNCLVVYWSRNEVELWREDCVREGSLNNAWFWFPRAQKLTRVCPAGAALDRHWALLHQHESWGFHWICQVKQLLLVLLRLQTSPPVCVPTCVMHHGLLVPIEVRVLRHKNRFFVNWKDLFYSYLKRDQRLLVHRGYKTFHLFFREEGRSFL